MEQLKDKEAYLADYFGEASIPFAANTARPLKQSVPPKAKDTKPSKSSSHPFAETSLDTHDTPQMRLKSWLRSMPASEQDPVVDPLSVVVDTEGVSKRAGEQPQHRLRSSSRLAQQEALQMGQPQIMIDQGKLLTEDNSDIPPDSKVRVPPMAFGCSVRNHHID